MRINELLPAGAVRAQLKAREKIELIEELAKVLAEAYPEIDTSEIADKIIAREKLGSTGIGNGIAIPHCKMSGIDQLLCCFGRSRVGIEFDSSDYKPAHIFFALVAPENAAGEHLKALASISKLCQKPEFRKRVMDAEDDSEIYRVMLEEDESA